MEENHHKQEGKDQWIKQAEDNTILGCSNIPLLPNSLGEP